MDFKRQAIITHEELKLLIEMAKTNELPMSTMLSFDEDDIPPLEQALEIIKRIAEI